jgi:phenylacetate-CoA ligase
VHLVLQRRRYFDAFQEFSDAERAACCAVINHVKPDAIVGYSGMLADIARFARDTGALTWKARTLIATAEGLMDGQRALLERELAHEVFDSYGAREVMNIGSECESHHGLHLAIDNLLVEIVDANGEPVPAGTEGRVLVTDFHNSASPLIRYEVGDNGTMCPDELCTCGRPFPRLASVDGRSQDMIHTPKGPITIIWMGYILRDYDWIEGHQVVQHARDRILLRLLTRRELGPELMSPIVERLQERFSGMVIDYERVDQLERRPGGKYQLLISTLGPPAPGANPAAPC